jgi:transposase
MHRLSLRTTKTKSGATAVQVVQYTNHKIQVIRHLGSSHTDEELASLISAAKIYIAENTPQKSLFEDRKTSKLLHIDHVRIEGVAHNFARNFLHQCAHKIGLVLDPLYIDLAIMRIIEPASKRRTLELLLRYFGIQYSGRIYRTFKNFHKSKEAVERAAFTCAKQMLSENFFLVLYDVTTLYFETHKADDDLRRRGYSKDHKENQPQIVIGLLVTRSGFPLAHEVFHGKTFEGHTMLGILESFAKIHNTVVPTVVADAAMLSADNIAKLKEKGISYIVGARLANAGPGIIAKVSAALRKQDGAMIRIPAKHGDMVCSFSEKRYSKDKHEMDKQIARAKELIGQNETGGRAKFVQKNGAGAVLLNETLIKKTELLLGIKGYCTNIPAHTVSDEQVAAYYRDLWNVEQAFRMSKNDLETRPIFHHKEDAIRAHVLLCFVSLMIGRYLEISTKLSLRSIRDLIWGVTDVCIRDTLSGDVHTLQSSTEEVMKSNLGTLMEKWKKPY